MKREKVKIFKALSDSNRLRILKMLQSKPLCVCEITEILGLATSTVSKHLSILRDAGFLLEEKEGKWINYRLNARPEDERITSFLTSLDFWIGDDEAILNDKKRLHSIDRYVICSK